MFNRLLLLIIMLIPSSVFAADYSIWLAKCEPYRTEVERILKEEGISTDYYFLMVAESKCTDKAISKKGAQGFWQLMPATAKHYGCNDPNNLECATKAAAKYIHSLSKRFVSFNDVIAGYNMGGHNYSRYGKTNEAVWLILRVNEIKKQDCMGQK